MNQSENNNAANGTDEIYAAEIFTFDKLPENLAELQARPEASLKSAYKTTALTMAALCSFEKNEDDVYEMLDFLKGPDPLTAMEKQFLKYQGRKPVVYVIPVGSLEKLHKVSFAKRKKCSLVTASRLASEKHLDWAIRAVAKAKQGLPDLTLDIYGSGSEEASLRAVINECGAGGYIRLMGHQKLDEIY